MGGLQLAVGFRQPRRTHHTSLLVLEAWHLTKQIAKCSKQISYVLPWSPCTSEFNCDKQWVAPVRLGQQPSSCLDVSSTFVCGSYGVDGIPLFVSGLCPYWPPCGALCLNLVMMFLSHDIFCHVLPFLLGAGSLSLLLLLLVPLWSVYIGRHHWQPFTSVPLMLSLLVAFFWGSH